MQIDTEKLYLDYVNNFLTLASFAEYYGLSESEAQIVIDCGREINQRKAGLIPVREQIRNLITQ